MPIAKIDDLSGGWVPDAMPEELDGAAWSSVKNMRFRNGMAERFRGMANVFGVPGAAPYWIAAYSSSTTRYWVTACLAKLYAYDGASQFDITPTVPPAGGVDNRYTGGSFNGVMLFNNGWDAPWVWGGATGVPAILLPNWDPTHRALWMRPFGNYIFCGGITKGANVFPHMLKWSAAAVPGAVPGSWDPADPTQDANERDLAETPDLMVDALPMGDQLIIYKERSMYSARYVGAQQIFATQRIAGETGMLARGCAVDTPIGHVVLTAGDVVVHQGGPSQSIANGAVRKWIFGRMNSQRASRSFVVSNPQKSEVLICFPSVNSETCNSAAVYNWETKKWGQRDLVAVTYGATGQVNPNLTLLSWNAQNEKWNARVGTWNENQYAPNEARVLFARAAPAISAFDVSSTDFGTQFAAKLERIGLTMGEPARVKYVRALYPRVDAVPGTTLQVSVGYAENASAAITWQPAQPFVVGQQDKVDVDAAGRRLAYRIEATGYPDWRMRSMSADVEMMGLY